ncbi:MAG TPA: LytTR family DNA-binding domain-containing protein [Chryseolinea sp.]|nr:LytTR family DNA-binding domain-containing protein [Chryseolinea sp.]
MDVIKAVIIDDESYACQALATLLKTHCPDITVAAICQDPREAVAIVEDIKPQLVFLDIEMPHMNGFGFLEKCSPASFDVIFTTSYDQYAIKAIKISALDYLLKPVDATELKAAVQKYRERRSPVSQQQFEILLARLQHPSAASARIALPTMEGLQIILIANIIFCSSSSNYTILTLKDNQKLTVSKTLKEIEEMLEEHRFLRIHHSYLVNLDEIRKYFRGEGGTVLMSDGSSVDVSRAKKELLLKELLPDK